MKPKIAFFDVDWTLYDHKNHRWMGLDAVRELARGGTKVFLCSARPYETIVGFGCFELGIPWSGYISAAGAIAVIDGSYVRKELVRPDLVKGLMEFASKRDLSMELVTPTERFMNKEADETCIAYHQVFRDPIAKLGHYHGQEITGALLFAKEEVDGELAKEIPGLSHGLYRFQTYGLDVSERIHHKSEAIQDVLSFYGFSKDDAIAFGDGDQDACMAEAVGVFVAMGNGTELAKSKASFVTDRIEDDGLSKALRKMGLIES